MDARLLRRLATLFGLALHLWSCTSSSTSTAISAPSGSKCDVSVAASIESLPPSGGSGTLTVTTERDCTWAASSDSAWITITAGSSGQGSGAATFRVAANPDAAERRATLAVNEHTVAVVQEAACRFVLSTTAISAEAAGGSREIGVDAGASCEWTAASDADWVSVRGGGPGSGAATIDVAANRGGPRTARVVVAGQSVSVSQAGAAVAPCTYVIDPAGQAVGQAGGPIEVTITTGANCAWTAASNAPWIGIARNAAGSGPSTVGLSVAANPGAARSGTATIAGITFTVTQSPVPCAFALSAASAAIAAAGGGGSVGVTASEGCAWSASSQASWLTLTGESGGAGNGSVAFAAAPNAGAERTGTLTVAGLTFTVTQAAAPPTCTYTLTPSSRAWNAPGGTASFAVDTADACAWTATVTAPAAWVTIVGPAAGTGPGTVSYKVERNRDADRVATIQVMSETFTISQTGR